MSLSDSDYYTKNAANSLAAIDGFAGNRLRGNELRNLMANAIVAQLIGDGVIKGGTGLKFRYGEAMSRVTKDLADGVVKADLKTLRARAPRQSRGRRPTQPKADAAEGRTGLVSVLR